MKYRSLLILSLLLALLCQCKRGGEKVEPAPVVFTSSALQDSLVAFAAGIDSLPNPYGAPTTIVVALDGGIEGASAVFMATPGFQPVIPGSVYKGMCRIAGKNVGFYAKDEAAAAKLLVASAIDTVFPEALSFLKYYDSSISWRGWYPPSRRQYSVSGDGQVELVSLQAGNYELFRRQHFGWPKLERRKVWQPSDVEALLKEIEEFNGVNGPVCALGGKLFFNAAKSNPQALESILDSHSHSKAAVYFQIWYRDLSASEKEQVQKETTRIKSDAVRDYFQKLLQ